MPASPDDVLAALRWRYATKAFDPARTIDPATWAALEQAAVLAPSSYGLQPWRFVVVTDPAVRKQLHPVSWNQPQIVDASHLVVFAAKNPPTPAEAVGGGAAQSADASQRTILGHPVHSIRRPDKRNGQWDWHSHPAIPKRARAIQNGPGRNL